MNRDLKYISFSSPKGGVGRTLTLCNCAKIYATGSPWAGIHPCITLLADLDFNAPGLHYYDFSKLSGEEKSFYYLASKPESPLTRDQMLDLLDTQRIGLLFLLTAIIRDEQFSAAVATTTASLNNGEEPDADIYKRLNGAFTTLLRTKEYNPLDHLIQIENAKGCYFIFPAASPNHPDFNKCVFDFDWLGLILAAFGILLLDCIFLEAAKHIRERKGDTLPVRILLDQQAGVSIPSAVNRSLADASVYVSGLNSQNKIGVRSLVRDYIYTHERTPWIVLNQYNFRQLALDYSFDKDTLTPHERFRKYDQSERKDLIDTMAQDSPDLREKVFVTEFLTDAIQKEHFYGDRELALNELTRLLVSIEKSFLPPPPPVFQHEAPKRIVVAGEMVMGGKSYSGPLNGIYELLIKFFPPPTIVIAIAATHEDVADWMRFGKIARRLERLSDKKTYYSLGVVERSGIYNLVKADDVIEGLRISDVDFVSWPYYIKGDIAGKNRLKKFSAAEFLRVVPTGDAMEGTSTDYYRHNILRWHEYVEDKEGFIEGVPLFVDFELLVYRKNLIFNEDDFRLRYRAKFHRDFVGFRTPQDLLDFATITGEDKRSDNNVKLCSNPKNIAMWYEWQTIFSIFYEMRNPPKENLSVDAYRQFLLTDPAIEAMIMYLELIKTVERTSQKRSQTYDWDELNKDFFIEKKNGLIFAWPDALPKREVEEGEGFIYQAPPSFHHFEECYQLSIVDRPGLSQKDIDIRLVFLNYYLTLPAQQSYTRMGGLPVHKAVLSDLDIWYEYPFIPPIWKVYSDPSADSSKLNKRESFPGCQRAGLALAKALWEVKNEEINLMEKIDQYKETNERLKTIKMSNADRTLVLQEKVNQLSMKDFDTVRERLSTKLREAIEKSFSRIVPSRH